MVDSRKPVREGQPGGGGLRVSGVYCFVLGTAL